MKSHILIIAGSDSGGGAGIQADIKTVTLLGGYATTAITALTAQNTQGVFGIHEIPEPFIKHQIELVLSDIGADCIKTGMLHKASVIETIHDALKPYPDIPLVLDPVMVAKGGAPLLQPDAIDALKSLLIPRATIITPNIPEAELLMADSLIRSFADSINSPEAMTEAGEALLSLGSKSVLMKGGHLNGETVTDILIERISKSANQRISTFTSPRIHTTSTHGTGCTLASAIATGIAQGMSLKHAVTRARDYVQGAIRHAPGLGKGHGPLDHGWMLKEGLRD